MPVTNNNWYRKKILHREDGPAVEFKDGSYMWYLNGQWHRVGGPAQKIRDKYVWCQNGLYTVKMPQLSFAHCTKNNIVMVIVTALVDLPSRTA